MLLSDGFILDELSASEDKKWSHHPWCHYWPYL